MKKLVILTVLLVSLALCVFATGSKEKSSGNTSTDTGSVPQGRTDIENPDTFIYGIIGDAATLDPAVAYDNASGANMNQIYDKLIDYDRGELSYIGVLAEDVPTKKNGGISADGLTYRFKIKKGIKFQEGQTLTPEDVEYSIERVMVVDPDNGPAWMYYMVFLNDFGSRDGDGNLKYTYADIDPCIEVDGDYVVFKLAQPFEPFLGILAGYWGSIVSKEWVASKGGWDGTGADMKRVNNPPTGEETLYEIANGTGPFKLNRWVKNDEIVVDRFDGYWGEKPAMAQGIYKIVDEWSTRKLMFLQGDLDYAYVEPVYYDDMDKEPGILSQKDLPSLGITGIFFNQQVSDVDNPLLGSAKLDGKGVPKDFFADKNVRLAFCCAWDSDTFITEVLSNTAIDPVTPFPYGLAYKNEKQERLPFDLEKSAEYFKKAYNGQLWEKGFTLEMAYNSGNEVRGGGLRILAENISSINPKFKISVRSSQWAEYLDLNKNGQMPIFFIGWAPDYPDPDNYADPFMYSNGYFPSTGHYKNDEVDALILEAKYATDPKVREKDYYRLQELWVDDAVGIATHQATGTRYYRDWLSFRGGIYYQPVNADFYNLLRYIEKK